MNNFEIIPIGYITKMAMDIEKGDYVKLIGKVLHIQLGEDQLFVDEFSGQEYFSSTVELEVESVIPDRFQYFLLPMDEEVRILTYAAVRLPSNQSKTNHVDKITRIM